MPPPPAPAPRRAALGLLAVSVALTVLSVAVAWRTPDPSRRGELARWVDALGEPTLPTWWTATLLLAAAVTFGLAGAVARSPAARRAWFAVAGLATAFSLAEISNLHRRLGVLLLGEGASPTVWLPVTAALALPIAAALLAAAAQVPPWSRPPLVAGVALVPAASLGGELAAALPAAGLGASLATHVAELTETVGAVLLLVAAARALRLTEDGGAVRLGPRPDGQPPAVPGGAARRDAGPVRATPAWRWLAGITTGLSLLSLTAVLGAPVLEPGLRELRLFLDVLAEHNLPTWWSVALLLVAALAHAAAYRGARLAGAPAARGWLVTAAVLALLALDDHTQLHERTERLGRLAAGGAVGDEGFPFYWLIPGAAAGLVVVAAAVGLAVHVQGRARLLLVGGVGLLLACALGLEVVQGWFLAARNEGLGFVLGYHLEELGENVAALMMLGAALTAVRLDRDGAGLTLRYTGGAVTGGSPGAMAGGRRRSVG